MGRTVRQNVFFRGGNARLSGSRLEFIGIACKRSPSRNRNLKMDPRSRPMAHRLWCIQRPERIGRGRGALIRLGVAASGVSMRTSPYFPSAFRRRIPARIHQRDPKVSCTFRPSLHRLARHTQTSLTYTSAYSVFHPHVSHQPAQAHTVLPRSLTVVQHTHVHAQPHFVSLISMPETFISPCQPVFITLTPTCLPACPMPACLPVCLPVTTQPGLLRLLACHGCSHQPITADSSHHNPLPIALSVGCRCLASSLSQPQQAEVPHSPHSRPTPADNTTQPITPTHTGQSQLTRTHHSVPICHPATQSHCLRIIAACLTATNFAKAPVTPCMSQPVTYHSICSICSPPANLTKAHSQPPQPTPARHSTAPCHKSQPLSHSPTSVLKLPACLHSPRASPSV